MIHEQRHSGSISIAMKRASKAGNATPFSIPGQIMNASNLQAPTLDLTRNPGGQPLRVDMERFFEFSFWMAEELLDLVAEHKPTFENHCNSPLAYDMRLCKSDRFGSEQDLNSH